MLEFGAFPPEINSGLMYTGPGAAPMLAAAAAWDTLATELSSTATAYGSEITDLTSQWQGPSSVSMATATAPYVTWMQTTAAQAEQAGMQAKGAVAAYEAAFTMTVPPPVIAANRLLLMVLVATNFFGQNTPAIAATEAHYAEMWAQDATAMYGYASAAAVASALAPFTLPPLTTNLSGLLGQALAAIQGVVTGVGSHAGTIMSTGQGLMSAAPLAAQTVSAPVASAGTTSGVSSTSGTSLTSGLSILSALTGFLYPVMMGSRLAIMPLSSLLSRVLSMSSVSNVAATTMSTGVRGTGWAARGGFGSGLGALGSPGFGGGAGLGGGTEVSAGMGRAATVGALSVPQGWPNATPSALKALPGTSAGAAADGESSAPLGLPMAKTAGRGSGGHTPRFELRSMVVPRSPAAG